MPAGDRQRLLFEDRAINYEQEVSLRLLHEAGHLFEYNNIDTDGIQNLLQTARAVRSVDQNLGLTAIGSLPFYQPDMKFHEDAAELIAMYSFDPTYLRSFLALVDEPANAVMLNASGIAVVPGYGNELFGLIENAVQDGVI